MSIRENIENGKYKSKLQYPANPKMPESLQKTAKDLTEIEIENLALVRNKYQREVAKCEEDRKAYRLDDGRLLGDFIDDLFAEHGVVSSKFSQTMYSLAWEHGHASGLSDVAYYFEELLPLYEIFQATIKELAGEVRKP